MAPARERVGAEAFEGERLLRAGVVPVVFLADWCPYCEQFLPELARLDRPGVAALVADLTDLESPLWDRFRVEVVPTVVVFRDGVAAERVDGIRSVGIRSEDLEPLLSSLRGHRSAGGSKRPAR